MHFIRTDPKQCQLLAWGPVLRVYICMYVCLRVCVCVCVSGCVCVCDGVRDEANQSVRMSRPNKSNQIKIGGCHGENTRVI